MPSLISKILHKRTSSRGSQSDSEPNSNEHGYTTSPDQRRRHVSLPPSPKTSSKARSSLPRQSLDNNDIPYAPSTPHSGSVTGPGPVPGSTDAAPPVPPKSPIFHRRQGDGPEQISPLRKAPLPPIPNNHDLVGRRSSLDRDTGLPFIPSQPLDSEPHSSLPPGAAAPDPSMRIPSSLSHDFGTGTSSSSKHKGKAAGPSKSPRKSIDKPPRKSIEEVIPERGSSLLNLQPGAVSPLPAKQSPPTNGLDAVVPVSSNHPLGDLTAQLQRIGLDETPRQSVPAQKSSLDQGGPFETQAMTHARDATVHSVVREAQQRKAARGELSEEARNVFRRGGLEESLSKPYTVDVETKWLEPVVQEHIIRREHTEYTTIINRHIHRHHVYPKIQPIEDPNPIILEPRHRIFSPVTGHWHELVGDEAARAVLGDEVFTNGPKEVRMKRAPALPEIYSAAGKATTSGNTIPRVLPTLGSGSKDLTDAGFGTGGRGAVEREGIQGQELGQWRPVQPGKVFGRRGSNVGVAL